MYSQHGFQGGKTLENIVCFNDIKNNKFGYSHWEKEKISHLEIHLGNHINTLTKFIIFDIIEIHEVYQCFSTLETMLRIHYVIFR